MFIDEAAVCVAQESGSISCDLLACIGDDGPTCAGRFDSDIRDGHANGVVVVAMDTVCFRDQDDEWKCLQNGGDTEYADVALRRIQRLRAEMGVLRDVYGSEDVMCGSDWGGSVGCVTQMDDVSAEADAETSGLEAFVWIVD